jgi:hypothetical protein
MTHRDFLRALKTREPQIAASIYLIERYYWGGDLADSYLREGPELNGPFEGSLREMELIRCQVLKDLKVTRDHNTFDLFRAIAHFLDHCDLTCTEAIDGYAAELFWRTHAQIKQPASEIELERTYSQTIRDKELQWFDFFRRKPGMYTGRATPAELVVFLKGYLHFKALAFPQLQLQARLEEIFEAPEAGEPYVIKHSYDNVHHYVTVSEPLAIYWNARWEEPGAKEEFWNYWESIVVGDDTSQ